MEFKADINRLNTMVIITNQALSHYGVSLDKFNSTNKNGPATACKQVVLYLMCEFLGLSTTDAGGYLGYNQERSIYAKMRVEKMEKNDGNYRFELNNLRNKIKATLQGPAPQREHRLL